MTCRTIFVSKFFCLLTLFITKSNSAMEPLIQGGQYAKIENFAHSVYLYLICREQQSCGGAILTQYVIMTAGHCFDDCIKRDELYAYAGSENTDLMQVADKITNYVVHKKYDKFELVNDIALAVVKVPMPLGKTMKRVIISRAFPGVLMARTAGWGVVDENTNQDAQKLMMVTQIVQPVQACNDVVRLKGGMMCAKNSFQNHPTPGDSGCALVSKSGQEIGLVSWRHTERKDVVIYTNVSYYYDWINKHSKELQCLKQ